MKTRLVELKSGFVPQAKLAWRWFGISSQLRPVSDVELQLRVCLCQEREDAQVVLDKYQELEENKRRLGAP